MGELLGIVMLVVLILVGALMPLKYTARMKLPKQADATKDEYASRAGEAKAGDDAPGEERGSR